MANSVYPLWKRRVGRAGIGQLAVDYTTATLKAALVDTGVYTYSAAHEFHSDLSGIVGTPQEITTPDFDASSVLDGGDVTYTGLTGNSVEAIVVYLDTGVSGTSPLVAYIDSGVTGLPLTPSGADATITWDAAGIFTL